MKKIYIIFISVIATVIIGEYFLRYYWGFCDALLYQTDPDYEYIAQPNQNRIRFGVHLKTNSFSQRSNEPDTTKHIILGLGDSVLFGGTMIDQDSLATSILTKELGIQVLNISAGSWGPDNCAAYLQKYGSFNAKALILICSSHDAYDTMTFTPVVGKAPAYPNKQYKSSIIELLYRYILPYIKHKIQISNQTSDPDKKIVNGEIKKKTKEFNPGFNKLKQIADSNQIPLLIYLHPEINEINNNRYNEMGQEIIEWCNKNSISLMMGLKEHMTTSMYRDIIHLNNAGQKQLALNLEKFIIYNHLN